MFSFLPETNKAKPYGVQDTFLGAPFTYLHNKSLHCILRVNDGGAFLSWGWKRLFVAVPLPSRFHYIRPCQQKSFNHAIPDWRTWSKLLKSRLKTSEGEKTSLLLLITNTFIACLLKGGKPRKVFFLQTLCFTSYRDSEKNLNIYMCLENLIWVKSAKVWRTSKKFCSSDWHFHLLPSPPQVGEC